MKNRNKYRKILTISTILLLMSVVFAGFGAANGPYESTFSPSRKGHGEIFPIRIEPSVHGHTGVIVDIIVQIDYVIVVFADGFMVKLNRDSISEPALSHLMEGLESPDTDVITWWGTPICGDLMGLDWLLEVDTSDRPTGIQ